MAFQAPSLDGLEDIKLLLIGDSGVGKTSLIKRYCKGEFVDDTDASSSVDFMTREVELHGKMVPVQVWDTAGQERFRTITSTFYKNAQGIIIVYNVDEYPSFRNVSQWLQEIERYGNQDVQKMLIGTKSDLANRMVDQSEAKEFAESAEMLFFETSAKSGDNVDDAFGAIVKQIVGPAPSSEQSAKSKGLRKRLRVPADNSPAIHSGWLTKRGGRLPHKWQKRWFVLSSQDVTYSAQDDADSRIRGTIYLKDVCELHCLPDPTAFNIVTASRVYQCQADSAAARTSWLKHLQSAKKAGKIIKNVRP